jgi:formylglycine-generating enzyme required for sulfatase activity
MSELPRREFLKIVTTGVVASIDGLPVLMANSSLPISSIKPDENLIHAPDAFDQWPAFRELLIKWRQTAGEKLKYDDALYRRQDFAWVPSCYCCCFVMMCDQTFYDPEQGRYTVESFLNEGVERFGGFDSVVLWHAYPRIGIDRRNQFDLYRDMPGGLEGLRDLTQLCHKRKVKVFIDYNPWDTGTRREAKSDIETLVSFVKSIDADGIFLDTMSEGAGEFRAKLDAARPGVVLEGEGALPLERVYDHHLSWAQGFKDGRVPGILRNKWFERRHIQHQIDRWSRDHTAELHTAWMNGSGMMVWENVFGTWVGWNARDRSILRAMPPIQHRYNALFAGEDWTPLVVTQMPDVYASLWQNNGLRLWTLVNRSESKVEGTLLKVPHITGCRYFDLIRGSEMKDAVVGDTATLVGLLQPRGTGAFVSGTDTALGEDFPEFLASQKKLNKRAAFDTEFPALRANLKSLVPTKKYAKDEIPPGMVEIPPAAFNMKVVFRVRECGFYESQDDHFKGSGFHPLHQPKVFERQVNLTPYAIDLMPVTNAQYAEFLKATGYKPAHPENFLKHWKNGIPPPTMQDYPVVYVDLDDARYYAKWAGKRLPTEEEWQYAAQGPQGLLYPWGNEMQPGRCNAGQTGGTTPVTAFPDGRSPFGCFDMCGNVWQWTEGERSDGRTRFCIIRGGSYYKAKGSDWYTDGGPVPCNFAVKFLMMWPGLDRCETIGFRCVVDLAEN